MSFEWDPNKAAANVRKHGVQFSEAVGVFSDDYAITINDDESDADAQRLLTLGIGIKGRILVVVYCYSGENIRIISARTAGRPEREFHRAAKTIRDLIRQQRPGPHCKRFGWSQRVIPGLKAILPLLGQSSA